MMQKVNVFVVVGASIICLFRLSIIGCDAKPFDIYDEIIDNDEKQLLIRMAELIASISGDSSSGTANNELKDMKPGERCILPVVKGFCRALIPRWSYDPSTKQCKEFKFGGCDGNGNNFTTRKQCMDVCRGI